jgi:hypothetical protein
MGTANITVTMAVQATLFETNRDTNATELVRRKLGGGVHEELQPGGRPESAAVALP